MKKAITILATLAIIGVTFGSVYARNASHPAAKSQCGGATGTITYKFWGDKGEDIEQLAAIKAAEHACPGLKVIPNWDTGNYDVDLATEVGSGSAPTSSSSTPAN